MKLRVHANEGTEDLIGRQWESQNGTREVVGIAPGSLDAMSQTEQWYLGMEKVKEVRRLNQQLNQKAFQRWMSHSSWVNSEEAIWNPL